MVDLLAKGIVVGVHVRVAVARHDGRDLGLGRLALLAAALSSLLLLHLLVTEGGQRTGDLLDLVAGHLLGELLRKLLEEERVVRLLRVGSDDGGKGVAEGLELGLGRGVEEGKIRNVDSVVGVLGVDDDGGADSGALTVVADTNVAEEILGVFQIGILLGTTETFAALGRSFLLVARLGILQTTLGTLGLVRGDALGL